MKLDVISISLNIKIINGKDHIKMRCGSFLLDYNIVKENDSKVKFKKTLRAMVSAIKESSITLFLFILCNINVANLLIFYV